MLHFRRRSVPIHLLFGCILCLNLALVLACRPARPDDAKLLHVFDFEQGQLSGWHKYKLPRDDSARVVTEPVRAGDHAVRFELRRADEQVAKGKRAELQMFRAAEIGREYWYGLSIFLPRDWHEDYKDEVVAQWNATADKGFRENEKRSPPLAIRLRDQQWLITQRYDARLITPPGNNAPKRTLWKGPYVVGKWTDWVVHARWSFEEDGLLEVWKDGVQIIAQRGPNCYNDRKGLRFKIGIYKPQWNSPESKSAVSVRHVFHDEIRIGGEDASYELVRPMSYEKNPLLRLTE